MKQPKGGFTMKKILSLVLGFMLTVTLAACNLTDDTLSEEASLLVIDVNPSIEIILDEDDHVVSVGLLNEDAEIALADVDLENKHLDEALDLINEALIETGYLEVDHDENIITITTSDEGRQEEMKEKMQGSLANRGVGAAVFGGELDDEYRDLAETYEIGIGRARLIARAVEIDEELTFEAALELPHQEIMDILRDAHRAMMESFIAERQAQAQETKEQMRAMAQERVEQHRQRVEDGDIEDIDFDEIAEHVRDDLDNIRNRYNERVQERRDNARERSQNPNHDDTNNDNMPS